MQHSVQTASRCAQCRLQGCNCIQGSWSQDEALPLCHGHHYKSIRQLTGPVYAMAAGCSITSESERSEVTPCTAVKSKWALGHKKWRASKRAPQRQLLDDLRSVPRPSLSLSVHNSDSVQRQLAFFAGAEDKPCIRSAVAEQHAAGLLGPKLVNRLLPRKGLQCSREHMSQRPQMHVSAAGPDKGRGPHSGAVSFVATWERVNCRPAALHLLSSTACRWSGGFP